MQCCWFKKETNQPKKRPKHQSKKTPNITHRILDTVVKVLYHLKQRMLNYNIHGAAQNQKDKDNEGRKLQKKKPITED